MSRAPSSTLLMLLAAMTALPLAACAPQDRYDQLITANRSLREQVDMLQRQNEQLENDLSSVRGAYTRSEGARQQLEGELDEIGSAVDGMQAADDETMRRIAALELGPLPESVENAVKALARAHPEILMFDVDRGMLRFSSDFSFDLGSDALKSDATSTLQTLAKILSEPDAAMIEVQVVGHTDNMPISRPETRRLHPTNWHLSVHRAISVAKALTSAGIEPARVQVAGYGENRPIVPNGTRGAAENRRVEIYLTALTSSSSRMTAAPSAGPRNPAAASASPDRGEEPMK